MLGLGSPEKPKRMVFGILILLLVDVIWVASSELTEYIFGEEKFDKPYFTNYMKNCMFIIYLSGFLFWSPWRQQCSKSNLVCIVTYMELSDEESLFETDKLLSEPMYVPVKREQREEKSSSDSDDSMSHRSVRFSELSEVRQLSESQAEDAALARLSYPAYVRAEEARIKALGKLPIKYVAKLAFIFCVLYFFANLSYQEALKDTRAGIVQVLSSTSGLFTLILAAVFPSSSLDRFTLSKFVMVLVSLGGLALVTLSDPESKAGGLPLGALWALCGAMLYAVYLVLLKRKADTEDKLDIPMFFGFVGLFTAMLLWPGFFILNKTKAEPFMWPEKRTLIWLVVNGLVGTVLSEFLWLWGCYMTSSLVGTLSLSLTIPLTMVADTVIKGLAYNWMFYVGSVPVFLSFFGVVVLSYWENWDPVLLGLKKLIQCIIRKRLLLRVREVDKEQTEGLIGINSDGGRGDS